MNKYTFPPRLFKWMVILSLTLAPFFSARAGSNLTSAVHFGYGAQINPKTDNIEIVVRNASQMGFNWLAVEFDWAQQWPDPSKPIDLSQLNQAASASRPYQATLMITVKNPPAWVLTTQGPQADYVAALVNTMMLSFPDIIGAIELFPGANRVDLWGVPANPPYYAQVLKQAQETVSLNNPRAIVVATVSPLDENRNEGDMDDLAFLSALYQAGIDQRFPVIGLNFLSLSGDPAQDPVNDFAHSLRHYEDIRKVMLDNGRSNDLIWVTSFSWPSSLANSQEQAYWFFDAYKLLRTQLYIGAAFFRNLNSSDPTNAGAYLINQNIITHPAAPLLQQLTATGQPSYYGPGGAGSGKNDPGKSFISELIETILSWLGL